jgi:6-phosphogluconolactonase (cycloisomerase 2 family)
MQIERIAATEGAVPGVCSISSVTALNMDISGAMQMSQFTNEKMEAASTAWLTIGEKQRTLYNASYPHACISHVQKSAPTLLQRVASAVL